MNLAGCQINPIDVNFCLQKSLEIFDKISADKIWSKKDKEIKVSPLMPIRVKRHPNMTFNGWIKLVHDWPLRNSRIYIRSLLLQEFFLELLKNCTWRNQMVSRLTTALTQEVDKITKPLIHFCCILIWSKFSQRANFWSEFRQQKHSIHVMIRNGL